MAENPVVNGYRYSWGSISITRGGAGVFGFTEINYTQSAERGEVRGHGRFKLGVTKGNVNQEGSLKLSYADWIEFRAGLGPAPLDAVFDLAVTREEDPGDGLTTDELRGCRIKSVEKGDSNGTDGSMVTLPLDIMQIVEDGAANFLGEVV